MFWDLFYAAIHANTSISGMWNTAQLQGDPARATDGLPLSELNYIHSKVLLQNRFGQPHELVNSIEHGFPYKWSSYFMHVLQFRRVTFMGCHHLESQSTPMEIC